MSNNKKNNRLDAFKHRIIEKKEKSFVSLKRKVTFFCSLYQINYKNKTLTIEYEEEFQTSLNS